MNKTKKKLSSSKGETILETLVALLIIVLSVSFLSAAIAKSAGIINDIKKVTEDNFTYSKENSTNVTFSATIDGKTDGKEITAYKVEQYKNAGLFYYYYEP